MEIYGYHNIIIMKRKQLLILKNIKYIKQMQHPGVEGKTAKLYFMWA